MTFLKIATHPLCIRQQPPPPRVCSGGSRPFLSLVLVIHLLLLLCEKERGIPRRSPRATAARLLLLQMTHSPARTRPIELNNLNYFIIHARV
jgi:hypothetical protein